MSFVPGHDLSARLHDVVRPAIVQALPGLPYAAALIGRGSDVLGFDTPRSTDHDWGPRLTLVLSEHDAGAVGERLLDVIERALPETIDGVPVDHLPSRQRPDGPAHHHTTAGRRRPHGVTVTTLPAVVRDVLGLDTLEALDPATWLSLPSQALLEFTAGPVPRDDVGELTSARERLAFYPDDVWLAIMAAHWQRIAQQEAFVGRAAEVGDDLGAHTIVAGIVRDAMRLAILQGRRYPPYAKWLGSAVSRTPGTGELRGRMRAALTAPPDALGRAVVEVLVELGRRHNDLDITAPVDLEVSSFFERPYPVIWAERFSDALHERITDSRVRALPDDIGSIDTITDHTLTTSGPRFRELLRTWWR